METPMKKTFVSILIASVIAMFVGIPTISAKTPTQIKNEKKAADAKSKSKAKSDAKKNKAKTK